jgi:hypothetical protein
MAKSAMPIRTYRLTDHVRLEMARRQISEADVGQVLAAPEQTECVKGAQSTNHGWSGVNRRKPMCYGWLWTLIESHQRL